MTVHPTVVRKIWEGRRTTSGKQLWAGPPTDALSALTNWVEHGDAPQTLSAATTPPSGRTATRDLCRYPEVSRYTSHADINSADSYRRVAPARH